MKILFIGDIVGKGGRKAVAELVPRLRTKYNCSFCIANAENSAGGAGLTAKCVSDILRNVDVITTGDHVWDQKNFANEITQFNNVLRPANMNRLQPGKGYGIYRNPAAGEIAVINLVGKVFMKESAYCPFETVETILSTIPARIKTIIVDIHAEATSEKIAMGRFLDGKVTAVLGTHTHVQTNDAYLFPGKTAYITDVGMVGSSESILGRDINIVIDKFRTGMPRKLTVIENNIRMNAVVITFNYETGRAENIEPISIDASY